MFRKRLPLQIIFTLSIAFICLFAVQSYIRFYWTLPELRQLEVTIDNKDVQRVEAGIDKIFEELQAVAYDNAVWDEVYQEVADNNIDYLSKNYFIADSFANLNLNGIYFYQPDHQLLASYGADKNFRPLTDNIFDNLPLHLQKKLLISAAEVEQNNSKPLLKKGFLFNNGKPAMFVSCSIMPSDGVGESHGTLVLWRFIDEALIKQLGNTIQLKLTANYNNAQQPLFDNDTVVIKKAPPVQTSANRRNEKLHLGFVDVENNPFMSLSFDAQARPYNENLFNLSLNAGVFAALIILIAIFVYLYYLTIRPINRIQTVLKQVMDSGDYSLRSEVKEDNEIGQLALQIDSLLAIVASQQSNLLSSNLQLQNLSATDTLTGLPNRRYLELQVAQIEKTASTQLDSMISILMIDIDHFKQYNDFYGHDAGDLALKLVATTLLKNTHNGSDFVARFGGEEFIVVLPHIDKNDALRVALRLREKIDELNIEHQRSDISELLTVSIGIADQKLDQHFCFETLFKEADDTLYQAKDAGRDTIILSGHSMKTNFRNHCQAGEQSRNNKKSRTTTKSAA